MNPSLLNGTSNSISVQNSIISGMSLATVVDMHELSKAKSKRSGMELVKYVNHRFTDSMLTANAPIIQSPGDPTKEHPILQQPVGIDQSFCDEAASKIKTNQKRELFREVMNTLEGQLQNESERKSYEAEYFGVSIITEKNLTSIPKSNDHATLGMRGAIANKDIKVGSPLIYSAQYRSDEQWLKAIETLADYLAQEFNLSAADTFSDAEQRLCSYAYTPFEFESEFYRISAYGAGSICAMVNHDTEFFNMIPFRPPFLDSNGKPVADVITFYASRDIEKGEQLLVDYGDKYKFYSFHEDRQKLYF